MRLAHLTIVVILLLVVGCSGTGTGPTGHTVKSDPDHLKGESKGLRYAVIGIDGNESGAKQYHIIIYGTANTTKKEVLETMKTAIAEDIQGWSRIKARVKRISGTEFEGVIKYSI